MDNSIMLPQAPSRPLRRLLLWTAWTFTTLILIVVLGFLYVTFVGISINASFLRGTIAQTFSDNIGRPVRFEGPMEIEISAKPKLRIGGLHIANAPGFGKQDFASLGEARLAVDLWPLLFKRKLHIDELAGSDVRAHLQVRSDGTNNWTFHRPIPAAPKAPDPAGPSSISADQAFALLDIQRVTLENLKVEYAGIDDKSHYFSLHALTAQSPANQPFTLTLNGAVEKEFPYHLEFTGGKLSDLATDKPWPIAFTLTFLSSTLTGIGSVRAHGGEVTFGLGTENLLEFERLLQTRLPDVGASGIAGTVTFTPHRVLITQLTGAMGKTTLLGALDFDDTGSKPKLSGSLALPTLDLRPFLGAQSAGENSARENIESPRSLAEVYRNLSRATFDLRRLNDADADLTLSVGRWLSLPGDVKDVSLQIKLNDGTLQAPVKAVIAGVALAGSADADANLTPPKFKLALGTRDSDLGGLAELLLDLRGVKGRLGRFDLKLSSQGNQGSDLVQSLAVKVEVERGHFSYGNIEGGRPVEFSLDQLAVNLPAGQALNGNLRGALLGHPFTAQLHAGALEPTMLQGRSPLDFILRSGDVHARIRGTLEVPAADRGPDISFEFTASHAGELASWFGFRPGAEAPAVLSGKASVREKEWQLQDLMFKLGRTTISANVARTMAEGKPLMKVRLGAEQIDVRELESMIPKSEGKKKQPEHPVLDIPLLPHGIDLTDADIAVKVNRFAGAPVEIRDVSFDGRIRDGYMHPSPFAANVAQTGFNGAVLFDLRSAEPMAGFWVYAANIDAGNLLRKLGVAKNLDASFSEFAFNFVARSSRLGEMLSRSELLGSIGGGRIVLRDPNTHGEARITVDKGELRADPGMPLRLTLKGALDGVPVSIALDTGRADQFVDSRLPLSFKLNAEAADTRVILSGSIARPIGSELELALDASGTRFDNLDKLARAALPPWGPWSAVGKFRMSARGYEVNELRLQVGESMLNGQGRLDTEGGRPRILIALTAPIIQLDDFKFGDWSPVEKKPDDKPAALTADEVRSKAAEASDQAQKLLSPEMLHRQDAALKVEVNQVLSGKDILGSGKLQARLENGRADIGPIELDVPGGSANLQLGYEPNDEN
ncbi:MAG TPA: AsmA family protein, partial [Burkholderiales bacterium]|nr:AsmA family protein [Burkholderiales bacterium]